MTYLLDVNLLIALLWPTHEAHAKAQRWFAQNAHHGWATCATTEMGFVRIVSNRLFSRPSTSPTDALKVLGGNLDHPSHRFWTEDISVLDALAFCGKRLVGHQQVTDAYLLGLAIHKRGKLATLDASVSSVVTGDRPGLGHLVLV